MVWYLVARLMIARWIETVRQAKCGVFEDNFRISKQMAGVAAGKAGRDGASASLQEDPKGSEYLL